MVNREIRSSLMLACLLVACSDDAGGVADGSTTADTTDGDDDGAASLTVTITDSQGDDATSSDGTTGGKADEGSEGAESTGAEDTTGSTGDVTDSTGSDGSSSSGSTGSDGSSSSGSSGGQVVCNDDGILDPEEACDGDDFGGATCESEGFTGGTLSCSGCQLVTDACTNYAPPAAGEVFFSELMPLPQTVPVANGGQWLEIHSPSPDTGYQLRGCEIEVDGGQTLVIDGDLGVAPLGFATLAAQSQSGPGFTPGATWDPLAFTLPVDTALLTLRCDGVDVDLVLYDVDFPITEGASLNLDPPFFSAADNDDDTNWCVAAQSYNGDFGTPGAANELCNPTFSPSFCHLQFPQQISDGTAGATQTVYGRVYMAGLTDQSPSTDPSPNVIAQVGYGPDGSQPADNDAWTWFDGTPNAGWNGPAAGEADNDEYQADMVLPAAGTYDFAYRFSGDFGGSFLYCDTDSGNDGYDPLTTGELVVQ